jgi:N-acetylneuraminic acid mutarotase
MKKFIWPLMAFLMLQCSEDAGETKTWEPVSPFSGNHRLYSATFAIQSKGYVTLGRELTSNYVDLWEYNTKTGQWTRKKDFEGTGREDAVGFAVQGKGYVGTGNLSGNRKDDFWEYDPANDDWNEVDSYPGGTREHLVGFVIGSKAYVGLGGTYLDGHFEQYNDFYEFDPSKSAGAQWTKKADIGDYPDGVPSGNGFAFAIAGRGYVGIDMSDGTYDLWEYDPGENTWTERASVPSHALSQGSLTTVALGGKAYIQSSAVVWQYDPTKNTWTDYADFPGADGRYTVGFVAGRSAYFGMPVGSNEFYKFRP